MFWNFYFLTDIKHETSCPLVTESFCAGKIIEGDLSAGNRSRGIDFLGQWFWSYYAIKRNYIGRGNVHNQLVSVHRLGSL
jgi:hypothetical protein